MLACLHEELPHLGRLVTVQIATRSKTRILVTSCGQWLQVTAMREWAGVLGAPTRSPNGQDHGRSRDCTSSNQNGFFIFDMRRHAVGMLRGHTLSADRDSDCLLLIEQLRGQGRMMRRTNALQIPAQTDLAQRSPPLEKLLRDPAPAATSLFPCASCQPDCPLRQ